MLLELFILNMTDPKEFSGDLAALCAGTFIKPQLKQSCGCFRLISCTGEPVMLRLQL